MIVPVRCFTCGKVIGDKYREFLIRTKQKGENPQEVLDSMGFQRVCCRRMIVSSYESIDEVLAYSGGVKK